MNIAYKILCGVIAFALAITIGLCFTFLTIHHCPNEVLASVLCLGFGLFTWFLGKTLYLCGCDLASYRS